MKYFNQMLLKCEIFKEKCKIDEMGYLLLYREVYGVRRAAYCVRRTASGERQAVCGVKNLRLSTGSFHFCVTNSQLSPHPKACLEIPAMEGLKYCLFVWDMDLYLQ